MRRILVILALFVCGCLLVGGIYLWTLVSQYDDTPFPTEKRDVAIVLGAALWEEEPSPALRERLEAALQLYEEGLVEVLVLSGGEGNDGISEAEGMKRYLAAKGIPAESLLLENQAANTWENLHYSQWIIQQAGATEVYLVTHDYHMKRAMEMAKRIQMDAVPVPVHSRVLFTPYHKTRESLAFVKFRLFQSG
ncbi:YdcF family protein [Desmospora profundinema]|uniref:Uncharacterized SAM-binding protein YcdF (DUF218 family) n=1 Tax=Desmospora profundinema TaxID=1571184 RepID=A0ABU1INF7_9BACL|nr:YdcF family protein [Desmospora profundinema]MDR6226268.1 uncharacterized SAM-binding protein YcdF (DUF218 family) [Desmospora profundinema]